MNLSYSYQPTLFDMEEEYFQNHARYNVRSGAFVDNMSLPVHRWYRYSAGFSADWVRCLIRKYAVNPCSFTVLDPFCGVGTSLLACAAESVRSLGYEAHPFVHRIANAKILGIHTDLSLLKSVFQSFADTAADLTPGKINIEDVSPLLKKCYSPASLSLLMAMRNLFLSDYDKKTSESELLWLAITSILRSCSGAGTAQWQYVLPNKQKTIVQNVLPAFVSKATDILHDVDYTQRNGWSGNSYVVLTDARNPQIKKGVVVDLVVTSPPYPNNYDYADSTRLEMTFWGEINGWGDLQGSVRKYLIRSCSQHAAAEKLVLEDLLSEPIVEPIREDLSAACRNLATIRQTKGGKKTYHTMAAAYFRDLGLVFKNLRPLCRKGSVVCFVIGDSAPYGVYLHVDDWLGRLAIAAGFKSYSFEKIRDRNVKWKNRKHRIPLKEGRLWIEG